MVTGLIWFSFGDTDANFVFRELYYLNLIQTLVVEKAIIFVLLTPTHLSMNLR